MHLKASLDKTIREYLKADFHLGDSILDSIQEGEPITATDDCNSNEHDLFSEDEIIDLCVYIEQYGIKVDLLEK